MKLYSLTAAAFQFVFYTGSWVNKEKYAPFIDRLKQKLDHDGNTIQFAPLRLCNISDEDGVILIGHSFGGSRAILDAMKHPQRVAGLVLLNSHFNERWRMPYPGVRQERLYSTPVLTVLGEKDEKLPLHRAIDDLFVKIQRRQWNHHYIVNPGAGHFSGLVEPTSVNETDRVVDPVVVFVESLQSKNSSSLRAMTSGLVDRYETHIEGLSHNVVVLSNPLGVVDELMRFVLPRFVWDQIHWWYFLSTKAENDVTYMYEDRDHVYWKGSPGDIEHIPRMLSWWTRDSGNHHEVKEFRLPSLHPVILVYLLLPLFLGSKHSKSGISLPVLSVSINPNTTYYKIPHPHRVFSRQLRK